LSSNNPLRRIFDLYISDLRFEEIERLVKRESAEIYEFYKNEIPKPDITQNKFIRSLIFIRSLFNAFLLKMSAARRVFYLASLLIFIIGYMNGTGSYVVLSFIIINILLAFELADKLIVKDEIQLARKIQKNLLPVEVPENKFFDISAHSEPAKEVGGDYFEFIEVPKGKKTFIVIGDISGKGMAAALYMVRVQAIIQFLIQNFESLSSLIVNLKKYFSQRLRKEYFLTLLASTINEDGSITFCRAGHSPVYHYKKDENRIDTLAPKGIGIGLNDKGIFEKTIEEITIKPNSGDLFILITDGITEAMNNYKQQFGEKRLINLIIQNADKTPDEIKDRLLLTLNRFRNDFPQHDDQTIIILKTK